MDGYESFKISIMPGYLPVKQTIFFCNAAADVVNDQVPFVAVVPVVRDEPNVGHAFTVEVPGNDITGLVVIAVGRYSDRFASAGKKSLQIRNSSMFVSVPLSPHF